MPKITDARKHKEGRGRGENYNYKPWIKCREINSLGSTTEVIDFKSGRTIHLLSQGERYAYYILRWNDENDDIREQYPLDIAKTMEIAKKLGVKHPMNAGKYVYMTTDLFVVRRDGSCTAYSVKINRDAIGKRDIEKLTIERIYWQSQGVDFKMIYKDDIDPILVQNIEDVVRCYNPKYIQSDQDKIRYLIAHKIIKVDMYSRLDYKMLIIQYKNTTLKESKWKMN